LGVAYHEDELPNPSIESYVRAIAESVLVGCQQRGLDLPHLHLEPGRSLVARAGVAIYRIGAVKRRANKTWLLTDGGMADNPRFALYGAKYSCLAVTGLGREGAEKVSVAGPYCESEMCRSLAIPVIRRIDCHSLAGAYHRYGISAGTAGHSTLVGRGSVSNDRKTVQDLLKNQQ
jgi:diaminopimelate decarboxylase